MMSIQIVEAQAYMTPWSCGGMACDPPAATAVSTIWFTSSPLSQERANCPSV
jgi:hypothetical protein